MKTRTHLTVMAILSGAALAAPVLAADTVEMKFVGTGAGRQVKINFNGVDQDVFAGELQHQFRNGTGAAAGFSAVRTTWCIDLSQHVSSDWHTFTLGKVAERPPVPVLGMAKEVALREVLSMHDGIAFRGEASNDMAAAFQLALWEIITDFDPEVGAASLDLSQGDFKATKTNGSPLAEAVMSDIFSMFDRIGSRDIMPGVVALFSDRKQDQITVIPVPLPTAGALALAGLLTAGAIRRRPSA